MLASHVGFDRRISKNLGRATEAVNGSIVVNAFVNLERLREHGEFLKFVLDLLYLGGERAAAAFSLVARLG